MNQIELAALVKAVQLLAFLCRTEPKRLDRETLKALDDVEDQLVASGFSVRNAEGELNTTDSAFPASAPRPMTPRSTAEEIDAVFRRNLDLLIQNLTVSDKNEITWMAISCRGVVSSLSTDVARKGSNDA